jgi:putative hydrolase of the HAD superfamily
MRGVSARSVRLPLWHDLQVTTPAPDIPIDGLILDYGEVLTQSQPPALVERMAALARRPPDEFLTRYWQHRRAYDDGLPAADYWRRVLAGEGEEGGRVPDAVLQDLVEADARSWMVYREEVWALASAFRARGGRTAMLSNGVPEIVSRLRSARPLEPWFDVVVVSCEVGCSKPDPEIYRLTVERLGVPAARSLFVDDRTENLAAAERAGLRTLHFTGDGSVEPLRRVLGL